MLWGSWIFSWPKLSSTRRTQRVSPTVTNSRILWCDTCGIRTGKGQVDETWDFNVFPTASASNNPIARGVPTPNNKNEKLCPYHGETLSSLWRVLEFAQLSIVISQTSGYLCRACCPLRKRQIFLIIYIFTSKKIKLIWSSGKERPCPVEVWNYSITTNHQKCEWPLALFPAGPQTSHWSLPVSAAHFFPTLPTPFWTTG